jgi:transposase
MLNTISGNNIFLACGSTDMRKSIDGLAAIVQICFSLDPFSPCLFAFCNKNRDKLKILRWEHNGFWLYYRRLENGKFQWPGDNKGATLSISSRQLNWLLDGLPIEQKSAHKKALAKSVI